MRLKTLLIIVSTLAVLSAIAFFVRRPAPPPSADPRLNQPLVEQSTIERAAKLRLSDAGKSITLARQSDGTWRVADYFDFPADFQKLSSFVGNLTDAKLQRLVTSNPDRIARLEFKDTKIELLDASDKSLSSVTLGKTAETGGGRFVRFGDEQKAFLSNLSAWLDTTAKNWADSTLVRLKPEDIAEIELSDPTDLTFTRDSKDATWTSPQTPESKVPDTAKLTSLLTSLTSLRFSDTTPLDDPKLAEARPHSRTVKLTTFDDKTLTLTFARKPEEKKPKPASTEKSEEQTSLANPEPETPNPESPVTEPATETIPAGPVFVSLSHSDPAAPINALSAKRAFQIYDYTYTSLPQKPEDLFTAAPPPPPPTPPSASPQQ